MIPVVSGSGLGGPGFVADPRYAGLGYTAAPGAVAGWATKQAMSQGGSFLLDPRVRKLRVGLAWDAGVDVDSSAVLLDKDHRVIDVIWFRKLHSNCGSVSHSGDDRTGEGGGDDETIKVKLAQLPPAVHYVVFVVNVFSGPNFSVVRACTTRLYHGSKKAKYRGSTLMEYRISQDKTFALCRGMFMCVMARQDAWWSVHALGLPALGGTVSDSISAPDALGFLREIPSRPVVFRRATVIVWGARNLVAKDSGGTSDPLYSVKFRKIHHKSERIDKCLSPVWREFLVDLGYITAADMRKLKVKVEDYDRFSSNDFMGKLDVPVAAFFALGLGVHDVWLPLQPSRKHSGSVGGEVQLRVSVMPA